MSVCVCVYERERERVGVCDVKISTRKNMRSAETDPFEESKTLLSTFSKTWREERARGGMALSRKGIQVSRKFRKKNRSRERKKTLSLSHAHKRCLSLSLSLSLSHTIGLSCALSCCSYRSDSEGPVQENPQPQIHRHLIFNHWRSATDL